MVILIPPAFPSASGFTRLKAPLTRPCKASPSIVMVSVASIETNPAFPRPETLASIRPPLLKLRLLVVILIPPAFPSASELT